MSEKGDAGIWVVDTNGFAYTLSLEDNKLKPASEENDIIKRISAVGTCAFAVGGDQDVYLYVHSRDVPIRVQVSTYENERWGISHKWSQESMFPTDRWKWSTQDGAKHTPKESFVLPPNWKWENEWMIDSMVPGDEEGWQYALDFPRQYSPDKSWKSCVRRRCWMRYRRFVTFDKWFKITPPDRELLVEKAIQDIAVGGTTIPGVEPDYIALWAVNFAGQVLYRTGISSICPDGKSWETVELPEEVRVGQISVGPTGMVWVITWKGTLLLRTGVSKFRHMGMSWITVETPQNERVYQLTVGINALWLLTMEGEVYFRKGISSSIGYTAEEHAKGNKWVAMVGTFSLLSMGMNDQIFALSSGSDHVYFRSDVTPSELSGHEWKIIKIGASMTDSTTSLSSQSSSQSSVAIPENETRGDDGTLYSECLRSITDLSEEKLHWNWISCGSCNIKADFFTSSSRRKHFLSSESTLSLRQISLHDEPWRNALLEMLELRDQREMVIFDFEQAVDQGDWSKSGRFRMLTDKRNNLWCDCKVTLGNEAEASLTINYQKGSKTTEMKLMTLDITCIRRIYNKTFTNCFAMHTAIRTMERDSVVLSALSEKDLNEWITAVTTSCQQARKCEGPPKVSAMWCASSAGDVFFSDSKDESDFKSLPAYNIYWRQVGGHMAKVEAGINHVMWGIGFDGKPWCFSRGFGGGFFPSHLSSAQGVFEQSDEDTFYTYENQRWNPVEGYGGRRLLSDRWEWSDVTGVLERRKDGYPLPNSTWQWADEWKVDFNTEEGTDKEGWMYALDFPRTYNAEKAWNDCVRRRRWLRKAKVVTTGPWVEVYPSIPLKDVSIQTNNREPSGDGRVAVWAVNKKGDVLFRNGVTMSCPQGKTWKHVVTNTQFVSISVSSNDNIWGVGTDGAAYLRTEYEGHNELGEKWDRIPQVNHPLRCISVGRNTVWAVDKFGEHFYRENVTETFPEGTQWRRIFGRVDSVSVAADDKVWVTCQGGLEKCFITTPEQPTGRGWVLALPDGWQSITARAICSPEEEKATKNKRASVEDTALEPVKQSSYKDLMESGDVYSIFGGEQEFRIPSSDSEGESSK